MLLERGLLAKVFTVSKMIHLLPAWCASILLLSPIAVLSCAYVRPQWRNVIYDELVKLNATCDGLDTCQWNRVTNDLQLVNCQCDSVCAELGTCCVNSKYRMHRRESTRGPVTCGEAQGTYHRMYKVEECKPDWDGDDYVRERCTGDVQTLKDPFLYVPVTDLKTGITFRNYFCFACNSADEGSDPPVFWELKLTTHPRNNKTAKEAIMDLKSENGKKRLVDYLFQDALVRDPETGAPLFYPYVDFPQKLRSQVKWCRELITKTCARDWTDVATKDKCEAYTALVWHQREEESFHKQYYRNVHCAICNHENLSEINCSPPGIRSWKYSDMYMGPYEYLLTGTLTFEQINKCPRNQVYDTTSRRCRSVRCGRRKKMVQGECVADPLSINTAKTRPPAYNPTSTPRRSWLVFGGK